MKITLMIAVALAGIPTGVSEAKLLPKIEADIAEILSTEGFVSVTSEGGVIEATVEIPNPDDLSKVPAEYLEDPTDA